MPKKFKTEQGSLLPYYWADGKLSNSQTHGLSTAATFSQAMDYSLLLIEGIRINLDEDGSAYGFRVNDYIERIFDGWRSLKLDSQFTPEQVRKGLTECVEKNLEYMRENDELKSIYVRPKIFRDDPLIKPFAGSHTRIVIECFPLGNYVASTGVTATLADYVRAHRYSGYQTKGAGKYVEYGMLRDSCDEKYQDIFQLGLGKGGRLIFTEGTTSNLFFVINGALHTPGTEDFILKGITRDSVLQMARYLQITVHEGEVPLSACLEAEEIFLTGTASFITPVTTLGRYELPIGPITKKLSEFFARVRVGREKKFADWLIKFK